MYFARAVLLAAMTSALWALPAEAQTICRAAEPSVRIQLPAHPYAALASANGCAIYVSTQNTPNPGGISLITFEDGKFVVKHSVPLTIQPAGLALTHDGKLLIAPGVDGIAFIDVARLASGNNDAVLATLDDGGKGPIQAAITADDKFLFVSDERSNTITLIDLIKARATGFKADSIIGKTPTSIQPVGLAVSPDQRFLYVAVEIAVKANAGEATCKDAGRGRGGEPQAYAQGVLSVIDVAKAKVIAELPAGCRPVRVVLSRDGNRAYVAARASSQIIGFDTGKSSRLGSVTLPGPAIGIALSADGSTLFASNGQTLTMIDTATIHLGNTAIKGTIPASGAGRELFIGQDGRTLLLTNYSANVLEIIDLSRRN